MLFDISLQDVNTFTLSCVCCVYVDTRARGAGGAAGRGAARRGAARARRGAAGAGGAGDLSTVCILFGDVYQTLGIVGVASLTAL